MIRIILAFIVIFGLFFFGIKAVRDLTGKDKWALTKLLGYSIICSVLSIVVLMGIVIIF